MNTLAYCLLAKKLSNVNWMWFYGRRRSTLQFNKKLHLADNVFKIKVQSAIHVCKSLVLLFVKILQFIPSHNPVTVQIHYPKPVLNTLLGSLILHGQNKPNKIPKRHLVRLPELSCTLCEYPLDSFSRQSIPRVFRKLLFFQEKVMVRIQLPELYVNHVKIFVTEKVWIAINIGFGLNVKKRPKYF